MFTERTSVGLDVHARSVVVGAIDGDTGEIYQRRLSPSSEGIRSWIKGLPGPVAVTYEAGPTGYGLYRALTAAGIRCLVAAPSKLVKPPGERRVKTDERDAMHLARLLRIDEITPVEVPSVEREAARDLVRAREQARADLMRARHRLSKLLLRHGIIYCDGHAWTARHDAWLRHQARPELSMPATRSTFDADYDAVLSVTARRDRLEQQIEEAAAGSEYTPVVHRLGCLRGIATLTAFALAVEIGDWHRFTGNSIGAYAGLVPSEHSSGDSRSQGPITKVGNAHVRRLLIEAAWHHRTTYRPGVTLRRRWDLAPPAARARGDLGNRRLHRRWVAFNQRRKLPTKANTAIARELAGWCWSLAVLEDSTPHGRTDMNDT